MQLLTRGKARGYQGHHIVSVSANNSMAGKWKNIQFLTRKEHFRAHNRYWRTPTFWRYRSGARYQRKFR